MARVWQRLAVAAVSAVLLLVLVQCNALKRKPGDKCVAPGTFTCSDPSTALLCQTGTLITMPCRGPNGCTGTGPGSQCDDDFGQTGEPCLTGSNGENYACGTDQKSELVCTAGKWTLASTCKGPAACKITGLMVQCDDNFADVGDPCQSNASDANYSCTPDKKTIVVCQQNKFAEWEGCRGPKGCHIEGNNVYCDTTLGKEGDMCRHADNHACSDDGTAMLKCTAAFKWTKQSDCKHGGCTVKGNEVDCK
jgi:hypothetical protein